MSRTSGSTRTNSSPPARGVGWNPGARVCGAGVAVARQVVGGAQAAQAVGDLAQDLVAHGLAVGLVEPGEAVDVEEEHADAVLRPAGGGHRQPEVVPGQGAVGQPGQLVEVGGEAARTEDLSQPVVQDGVVDGLAEEVGRPSLVGLLDRVGDRGGPVSTTIGVWRPSGRLRRAAQVA